jgi:hypothetical protein
MAKCVGWRTNSILDTGWVCAPLTADNQVDKDPHAEQRQYLTDLTRQLAW